MASLVGHELSVGVHPIGAPIRDKARIALLRRFAVRLHKSVRWRTEVPIPIPGDRRSADAVASTPARLTRSSKQRPGQTMSRQHSVDSDRSNET
jgi:hypothetical protein